MNTLPAATRLVRAKREHALSDETLLVMLELQAAAPLTLGELESATQVNFHTVRRVVSTLVRSGHAFADKLEEDARVRLFSLTGHGRRLVKSIIAHLE